MLTPDTGVGWRMVVRGLVAQNVAIGCVFGSAAITLVPLQERYDVGRGVVGFSLSLVVLMLGLLGPAVVMPIDRIGFRYTMLLGLSLSGVGYALLAIAPSMTTALMAFGLLIGPGAALFGSLPANLLASGWITKRRGLAVGLVNMPLLVIVVPLVGGALIEKQGLSAFYSYLALFHLLAIPVVIGIRSAPTVDRGDKSISAAAPARAAPLTNPFFWGVTVGGGMLSSVSVIAAVHIVAFGTERGLTLIQAAGLASFAGMATVPGTLLSGTLCDRLGGARTLALAASGLMVSWFLFLYGSDFIVLAIAIMIAGLCGAAVYPAVNILATERFGVHSARRVVGLYGLCTLPFSFLIPPAAGVIHDVVESYVPVFIFNIVVCAATAILFLCLSRRVAIQSTT